MAIFARDVMNPQPTTLDPSDTIERAADYIMQKRYRNLPIVDNAGRFLGMFGVHCLIREFIPRPVLIPHGLKNVGFITETFEDLYQRYEAIKNQPVTSCVVEESMQIQPDTPLIEILVKLYEDRSSIPVVDKNNRLLGMISYWDIGEKILAAGAHRDA